MSAGARRLMADALGMYAASRCVALAILLLVEDELHGRRLAGGPPFRLWWNALSRWDAVFYRLVAQDGYPAVLPVDASGAVQPNTWAFFPVFPLGARWLGRLAGIPFEPAALLLNVVAGGIAAVCLARLARLFADDDSALRAVGLWSFFPTAFVLQVPYAEACYALFAISFLYALITRRPWAAAILLTGAALSRGAVMPLSAAALVFVGREWVADTGSRSRVPLLSLAVVALLTPWLWMAIAAVVTGRLDAYAATQEAWGFSFTIQTAVARWTRGIAGAAHDLSIATTAATLAAACVVSLLSWRTVLPLELRVYGVAATIFLIGISQPEAVAFGSAPRFVFGIMTIPLTLAVRIGNRGAVLLGIVFVGLEYLWVLNVWSGRIGVAP